MFMKILRMFVLLKKCGEMNSYETFLVKLAIKDRLEKKYIVSYNRIQLRFLLVMFVLVCFELVVPR